MGTLSAAISHLLGGDSAVRPQRRQRSGALTALGTNGAIATKEVADGGREGPHAQTSGSDSAPTGLRPVGAGDRPELPALGEYGERLPGAGRRGEARLAAARRARRRHGARAAALPRTAPPRPHTAPART